MAEKKATPKKKAPAKKAPAKKLELWELNKHSRATYIKNNSAKK